MSRKMYFFCWKVHFLFILLGELAPRTKLVAETLAWWGCAESMTDRANL